jgi:hypothetical protein
VCGKKNVSNAAAFEQAAHENYFFPQRNNDPAEPLPSRRQLKEFFKFFTQETMSSSKTYFASLRTTISRPIEG